VLVAFAAIGVVDGAVLDGDVVGLEVHHFGTPSSGEDEDQEDGPVTSSFDGVGHDIEEASHFLRRVAPGR